MWITSSVRKWTIRSPSVWAGGTAVSSTRSSPTWSSNSSDVRTGRATGGEAGVVILNASVYCSVASRFRVAAVARIFAPALAEGLVAAGVVEVPVGVDQPRDRLAADAS